MFYTMTGLEIRKSLFLSLFHFSCPYFTILKDSRHRISLGLYTDLFLKGVPIVCRIIINIGCLYKLTHLYIKMVEYPIINRISIKYYDIKVNLIRIKI